MVLQWVEQKKKSKRKEECKDIMGWATPHFRCWVATQKWCRDRMGLACTTKRACQVRGRAGCAPNLVLGAHTTRILAPRSRHQFLCREVAEARTRLVFGRDMIFMSWRG